MDSPRRLPLNPERIYRAALELIDASSVEELSMRRLASALRVDAMSIYHHVANKQALLMGIFQTVLEELPLSASAGTSWQDSLRDLARRFFGLARKYPKVFPYLISSPYATPRERQIYEYIKEVLVTAGLTEADAARTTNAIYTYAVGLAHLAVNGICSRPQYDTRSERLLLPANPESRLMPEKDFQFSIDVFISGIEKLIATSAAVNDEAHKVRAVRTRLS